MVPRCLDRSDLICADRFDAEVQKTVQTEGASSLPLPLAGRTTRVYTQMATSWWWWSGVWV